MVSTCPPTSKSSSPFNNPLVTVPNEPITISIIVTSMFHRFFNSLARSRYLSLLSHSLADHNNAVVWVVSTCPQISKSSILLSSLCGLFLVHLLQSVSPSPFFFSSLARSKYLSLFLLSLIFHSVGR